MESIEVNLFKDSFDPFIDLLKENGVEHKIWMPLPGKIMASGFMIEVFHTLQSAAPWTALGTVLCAFLKNRRSRKVIITLHDNTIVHAEGYSEVEIERILARTKKIAVMDTKKDLNK